MSTELSGELLKRALLEYKAGKIAKKELRQASLQKRRKLLLRLELFLETQGCVFNKETARAFIDHMRLRGDGKPSAPGSITSYIATLRAFNKFCIDQGFLSVNFAQWIPKPPEIETLPSPVILAPEVIEKAIMLGTTPGKYDHDKSRFAKAESRQAARFMKRSGRRINEVLCLKGSDLHPDAIIPSYDFIQKGGKPMRRPLPDDMIDEMRKRRHKDIVFEITAETIIKHLRDGLLKLGIKEKIGNHTLRKIFAIERNDNGETIYNIASALGNTVKIVEKHYLSLDMKNLAKTVNNSAEINHGLPISEVIGKTFEYVRTRTKDDRFQIPQLKMENDGIVIKIPYSKIGLAEMEKTNNR